MFNIRFGEIQEVEDFQLFDSENQGSDIVVAELDGEIVGYMQMDEGAEDAVIYFMESNKKGCGTALIDWLKNRVSYILASNTVDTAVGFYDRVGFVKSNQSTGYYGQICMEWIQED
jgi:ribosomal protein S18 acetylase RimI-like enzyme